MAVIRVLEAISAGFGVVWQRGETQDVSDDLARLLVTQRRAEYVSPPAAPADWLVPVMKKVDEAADQSSVSGAQGPVGVLLLGQSNCVGWDANPFDTRLDYIPAGLMQFSPDGAGNAAYARKLVPASNPLMWPNSQATSWGVSPGPHFAAWLNVTGVERGPLVLIPAAVGGTALVGSRWAYPSGDLCQQAISAAQQFLNEVPGSRIGYIVIVQGEADVSAAVSSAAYRAAFDGLLSGIRSIPGISDAVVVVGSMVPEWVAANSAAASAIAAVHEEAPLRMPRCIYVAGATGAANGVHYTAAGYRENGRRWGRKVRGASGIYATPGAPAVSVTGRRLTITIPSTDCAAVDVEYRIAGGAWTSVRLPVTYWEPGSTVIYNVAGSAAVEARAKSYGYSGATTSSVVAVPAVADILGGLIKLSFETGGALGANEFGAALSVTGVTLGTSTRGNVGIFGGGSVCTAAFTSAIDLPPAYTKSAWILWNGTQATSGFTNIMSGDSANAAGDHTFGIHAGVMKASDGSTSNFLSSGIAPVAGVWEHWAVTRDVDGNQVMYRSGTEVARRSAAPLTAGGAGIRVGSFNAAANNNWQGALDDVRLYGRALSAAEIMTLASL